MMTPNPTTMTLLTSTFTSRFARRARRSVGIALGVCALFFYAGCDSLDVTNPNAPEPGVVSIQALATGIEGGMRAGMDFYWRASGILGRELYYFEPADPRYTEEMYTGPLDPGGFLLNTPWSSRYRVVRQALIFMEEAESRGLSAEEVAGINGFAKTIIGHQLLLNLNYLGDNGIKIDFSGDLETADFVSPAAAYDEINRYLDEGIADLANAGGTFPFALSSGFAGFDTPATFAQFNQAVQARVEVYRGNADAALAALDASFVDAGASMDLGVYYTYSTNSGDRLNPMFEVPTASSVKLRAHPDFQAQAEAGDQRFASKVLDRAGDASFNPSPPIGNGLSSALVVTTAASSSAPYPLLRNEELLLLRAEANILNNDFGAATADINVVRAAAGLDGITITAENAIDQLLHERFYSLFAEGHRWVDYRRFGRIETLPRNEVGDPPAPSMLFTQWPKPQGEVPG